MSKIHKYTRAWTDAQKMRQKYPDSFDAPDLDELAHLSGGTLIKFSTGQERPWAIVVDFDGKNITAILDSKTIDKSMNVGDLIQLQTRHIFDISEPNDKAKKVAKKYLTKYLKTAKIPKGAALLAAKGRGSTLIQAYQVGDDVIVAAGKLDITPYVRGLRSRSKKERASSMTKISGVLTDNQKRNFFSLFDA